MRTLIAAAFLFIAFIPLRAQDNVFHVRKNFITPIDSLLKIWIQPGEDTLSQTETYSFVINAEMKQYFDKVDCENCGMGTENGRVYFTSQTGMLETKPIILKFYKDTETGSVLVGHRFFFMYPSPWSK